MRPSQSASPRSGLASPTLHAPPSAASRPRASILKKDGRKKDFEAIRAAKHITSPLGGKGTAAGAEAEEEKQRHDDDGDQTPARAAAGSIASHAVVNSFSDSLPSIPQPALLTSEEKERTPSPSPTASAAAAAGAGSRQNSFKSSARRGKRRTSHQGMMSRLALQFPAIRESFAAVYSSFQQFCDLTASSPSNSGAERGVQQQTLSSLSGLGHITLSQFPRLLSHLTHHTQSFSQQQVAELFAASHLTHSPTLSFRECLIAVALGYYLAPARPPSGIDGSSSSSSSSDPSFERIGKGFQVVRRAFAEIDDDGSGRLDVSEMKQALFAASSGSSRDELLQTRFKELDLNGDGDVEFKEFLYGVFSWVGMTTEEEMDEIEQSG